LCWTILLMAIHLNGWVEVVGPSASRKGLFLETNKEWLSKELSRALNIGQDKITIVTKKERETQNGGSRLPTRLVSYDEGDFRCFWNLLSRHRTGRTRVYAAKVAELLHKLSEATSPPPDTIAVTTHGVINSILTLAVNSCLDDNLFVELLRSLPNKPTGIVILHMDINILAAALDRRWVRGIEDNNEWIIEQRKYFKKPEKFETYYYDRISLLRDICNECDVAVLDCPWSFA
jgi:hypothetical protein